MNEIVSKFHNYCCVDERLEPRVAKDYKNTALRFLKFTKGEVSTESIGKGGGLLDFEVKESEKKPDLSPVSITYVSRNLGARL